MVERKRFTAHRRDLFFELQCTCPNKSFVGTNVEDLMKHTIRLSGYADDNFFDNVNKEPMHLACQCGRKFTVQWFRDGVEAAFID